MRASKSKKLAEKMAALKAELKEVKHAEFEAERKAARRNFTRAARKAGLLRLVANGAVTPEVLEEEFRAVAERLKPGASATPGGDKGLAAAAVEQSPADQTGDDHKPFWKR